MRRVVLFCIFQISVMSGLIGDSWILTHASVFYLLQDVVLVEVYEDNPAPF